MRLLRSLNPWKTGSELPHGRGECSAGDLTRLVGSDQTTVSKHLAVLRSHGIVDDRREGSVVVYRLLTPCVTNFFSCATQVLKESR